MLCAARTPQSGCSSAPVPAQGAEAARDLSGSSSACAMGFPMGSQQVLGKAVHDSLVLTVFISKSQGYGVHLPCVVDTGGNSEVVSWWNKGEEFAGAVLCLSSPKLRFRGIPLPWWYRSSLSYCKGGLNQTYFYVFTIVSFTQTFCTTAVYFLLTVLLNA